VRVLGREFVEEYFSYDAKVWRTLKGLVVRPGFLTREYLAGRRARYLRPLRLYLTVSLAYFVAFNFLVERGWSPVHVNAAPAAPVRPAPPAQEAAARPPRAPSSGLEGRLEQLMERQWERVNALPKSQHERVFAAGIGRHLPNAMFVLMPVFALLLRGLYARSGRGYAEHFVFALHLHAFVFAVGTAALLVPSSGQTFGALAFVWSLAYMALAMRRVYQESALRTTAKFVLLVGAHVAAVGATMLLLVVISLLTV
jgi:hypothetical protein